MMTEETYNPNERKLVKVDHEHISLYNVFSKRKTPDESISSLVKKYANLRAEYTDHVFENSWEDSTYYVDIKRLENDEEYAIRMQKYENNRQAQILKQQNAAINKAKQKLKAVDIAEQRELASQREMDLYLALKAKYEGESNV
jgi:hypothetical protein